MLDLRFDCCIIRATHGSERSARIRALGKEFEVARVARGWVLRYGRLDSLDRQPVRCIMTLLVFGSPLGRREWVVDPIYL